MLYGYMGKILRVDLSEGKVWEEEINKDWAKEYLGGVGYATRILYEEVPKGVDPLGPDNELVFMTGPLTATESASAARYDVVFKSPLTGIWGHENFGGSFGSALKKSGYDGIVLRGVSPKPVYLKIENGKAELKDASKLWGKLVPETEAKINEELQGGFTITSIGPAGEKLSKISGIVNDQNRLVGRCGSGAVMGSKNLKAIACKGNASVQVGNPDAFQKKVAMQDEMISESMAKVSFETFGTNLFSDMVNEHGGYPTKNWQFGTFDEIEKVNGVGLMEGVLESQITCYTCPIACGRGTAIKEGKWAGRTGEGPEYETVSAFGASCGVSDLNAIAQANYLCNEYGLDPVSAGSTVAFAIECYEKGALTKEQTGGLELNWGDGELIVKLTEIMAKREGELGGLLADGTKVMSEKLDKGSGHFAIQIKGLELPAYDPRAAKICGLGYVTSNRGGDHIAGYAPAPSFVGIQYLLVEDSSVEDRLSADPEYVKKLVNMENVLAGFYSVGGCKYMGFLLRMTDFIDLFVGLTGREDLTADEYLKAGERTYNLERVFNCREGLTREDDILPGRLMEDPLPDGPAKGQVMDRDTLEGMKDAYYEFRKWDKATGKPSPEKLTELGLEWTIKDIW